MYPNKSEHEAFLSLNSALINISTTFETGPDTSFGRKHGAVLIVMKILLWLGKTCALYSTVPVQVTTVGIC